MVAEENIGKGISDSPSGARDALELQPPRLGSGVSMIK
jgi:hypothetical protein